MLSLDEAIDIFKRKFPNKDIILISIWNDKYVFRSDNKDLSELDRTYDLTGDIIDIKTGAYSNMNVFDLDYMNNAKTVYANEKLLKEVNERLTVKKYR